MVAPPGIYKDYSNLGLLVTLKYPEPVILGH